MPVRKPLARRATGEIDKLLEIIASGAPWQKMQNVSAPGYWDVYALVSGLFYLPEYCRRDDEAGQRELWQELREEILAEHIRRRPGTRPWGWWKFDAPQMRRVVGIDRGIVGDEISHLPAFEDPHCPQHAKQNYFGKPNTFDGFLYEGERAYLARLKLLIPEERNRQRRVSAEVTTK